ncbi:hypothetical protein GGF46_004552 [Coemansia sp. RSA 552]|nr:hypothetical protein GGF46_004552 [Coemansia sp. RSA 552]
MSSTSSGAGGGDILRKYTPVPTPGTAPLHSTLDYGHADFYPARPDQAENQMTERTIRYGLVDSPRLQYEHLSGHDVVFDRLKDTRVFQELQAFAAGTAQRQWARGALNDEASERLPRLQNRTVRSDDRREEWLGALANPRVPLSSLSNDMPFGLRGERLLDALRAHEVPITRALWAIRLTGVYEMIGLQTKAPDHASMKALEQQYTSQWSKQFAQFVEHTLITAPTSTGGSGGAIASPAMGGTALTPNVGTPGSRTTPAASATPLAPLSWARSWTYCLALLHAQYSEGLLDQRHLVSWLVTQFRQAPVDRCILLLALVRDDYASEIAKSRNPLRKLISAVVFRIEQTAKYASLQEFHRDLCSYLISLFVSLSDAFVEPSTWVSYRAALVRAEAAVDCAKKRTELKAAIHKVDRRNIQFGAVLPDTVNAEDGDGLQLALLRHLGTLGPDSDIASVFSQVFSGTRSGVAAHTVRLVCYWAVEGQLPVATTEFRQLAAAHMCKLHLDSLADSSQASEKLLQAAIVGFLDIFPLPRREDGVQQRSDSVRRICLLLERLADVGCFSISKYLQLLTARGDFFGSNVNSVRSQQHLEFVMCVPTTTLDDREQQQMLLYDCGRDSVADALSESPACGQIRSELARLLPFLISYTCTTPLRAKGNGKAPTIDLGTVHWWLSSLDAKRPGKAADLLDQRVLPTPAQIAGEHLASPLANAPCTKDWIAPVPDHIDDEQQLNRNLPASLCKLLRTSPRSVTGFVVKQRLLPAVYDFVVKDVKVGVDNWRVITQPGTSLLNRRQTAVVIQVLIEAGYFYQLLDFLVWVVAHTRVAQVTGLALRALRRFTREWVLQGRLVYAIDEVQKAYAANCASGASDSFDLEVYRTAQHWHARSPNEAKALWGRLSIDYDAYVSSHSPTLVQGAHHAPPPSSSQPGAPATSATAKELLQLAQQLVRDRIQENISSTADEIDWAILPCFQKLTRWAAGATHHRDGMGSPSMHMDLPSSPVSPPGSSLKPRLKAMLTYIVNETTGAAMHTGRTLPMDAGAKKDEAVLSLFVELCALFVRWFALNSGLFAEQDFVGKLVLKSLATAIGSWSFNWNSASNSLSSSSESVGRTRGAGEIEVAMYISHVWISSLLASGCLRMAELVPWIIGKCCEQPATAQAQNSAQYTCLAGVIHSLSMPSTDALSKEGAAQDHRYLYEVLEMGANWATAMEQNKVCRIQAVELVVTSAAASGRLRNAGVSQIATMLMQAASALAQSEWIQAVIDYIPSNEPPSADKPESSTSGYYSIFEIYRANIEKQIQDPQISLPVKRAVLRALMTLCEGVDPDREGFSAMTTAEVAHRLQKTLQRFWLGPADKGRSATTEVSKLSTILNSLLLFASTALRESEASTDAFAVAAGASSITLQASDAQQIGPGVSGGSAAVDEDGAAGNVQFVTNATAHLAACVQDAVLSQPKSSVGNGEDACRLADRRCASLAEALSTLSPEILFQLIESCSRTLFTLATRKGHSGASANTPVATPADREAADQPQADLLDRQAMEAMSVNYTAIQDIARPFASRSVGDNNDDGEGSISDALLVRRGTTMAWFIQRLVARLSENISSSLPKKPLPSGCLVVMVRDFASGILGQLQVIALKACPDVAARLSLAITRRRREQGEEKVADTPLSLSAGDTAPVQDDAPGLVQIRMAVVWRLQAMRPLCQLMRSFPDEFGAGEWLLTLVTLCLSDVCQGAPLSSRLFQLLVDFAAIINEGFTPPIRKYTLALLRSIAPLLPVMVKSPKDAEVLGRLFPFEVSTARTRDIVPKEPNATLDGVDNPWMWIEGLEFVPLAPLNSTLISSNAGLEGMTPFTLRGMLEQENNDGKRAREGPGAAATGYLANLRFDSSEPDRDKVATLRKLQYLESPYFPMQPAMLFDLAETPVPWRVFGGKRRRMDSETRLVWRSQCEAAFGGS